MKRKIKAYLYTDRKKEWRFIVKAGNGRTIAQSSESYKRRIDCLKAIWLIGKIKAIINIEATKDYKKLR